MTKEKPKSEKHVMISAPKMETLVFRIVGTSPYVSNKFSAEARAMMHEQQALGLKNTKGKKGKKDFEKMAKGSMHVLKDGSMGLPANAFRQAMIDACRLVNFKMTLAKLSVFVEHDEIGEDGTPLVKVKKGKPYYCEHYVRQQTTCDLRPRMMLDPGWEADVRVNYDAEQFNEKDIANLMLRVGRQVGIGAGRNSSKDSSGMGWGCFDIKN